MLEITLGLMIYSVINCFQFAAGILANQIGLKFWHWFWIALFLPVISLIILLFIWSNTEQSENQKTNKQRI